MGKPIGPKKVHRYSNEFEAVRLSLHPDIETQDVAWALDIHPFMLSRWKKGVKKGEHTLPTHSGYRAGMPRPQLIDPRQTMRRRSSYLSPTDSD